jgi:hypothetical protein
MLPPSLRCAMCDQCNPINEKINRYMRLRHAIADKQTQDAPERLLIELVAKKAALHLE